ncbi:MAG: hypothetical protein KF716_29470 [Anaerolineae bacterium]|nr:hypothetical protein [Anaerolineae bacterium]
MVSPIHFLMESRTKWSDDEILAELESLPVLPDMMLSPHLPNPVWEDDQIQAQLDLYLALGSLVDLRKLRAGVPLLVARACYGHVCEAMLSLPRSYIRVFAPDLDALSQVYIHAARYPQKGARLWAVESLGELLVEREGTNNPQVLRTLMDALCDSAYLVRRAAISALENVSELPEYRGIIVPGLEEFLLEQQDTLNRVLKLLGDVQRPFNQ